MCGTFDLVCSSGVVFHVGRCLSLGNLCLGAFNVFAVCRCHVVFGGVTLGAFNVGFAVVRVGVG